MTSVDAHATTKSVSHLFNLIESKQLDLEPPWQRGFVWSPKRQKELIKSILLGIPTGAKVDESHFLPDNQNFAYGSSV